jgi:hypothetical protein
MFTNPTFTGAVAITGGTITGITDLTVADGGTGASSITANSVVLGNGTSALSGNLVAPSTSGNVLTSNGTTWTSAAPVGGLTGVDIYYSSTSVTYPSNTKIKVTVVGGGGGCSGTSSGGSGGVAVGFVTVSGLITITVGGGGAGSVNGTAGEASSFGSFASATGGGGGINGGSSGADGVGTVSSGTSIISGISRSLAESRGVPYIGGGGTKNTNSGPVAWTATSAWRAGAGASVFQFGGVGQNGGSGGVIIVEY